jgi:hypothetical protein
VSVLNQFFGLSSDAIASEPIQMLLKEPLIVEASTNFAIGCQRYHDSLLKYQQVKLTKQRDRLPSKSTTEKEGDVAKLEADTTMWLRRAHGIQLQSESLAARTTALVALQEASTAVLSNMEALTSKWAPLCRNKENLIRAASKDKWVI